MLRFRHWLPALAVSAMPSADAHHSFAANFFVDRSIEIEGEVIAVRWRNPHIEFDIAGIDENGLEHAWTVESDSLSGLRGRGITEQFVAIGDDVRVAGNPGRRKLDNVYMTNLLMANGRELVLRGSGEARFSDRVEAQRGARFVTEGDASAPELGIFRIWITPAVSPFPFPEDTNPPSAHTDFPLTDAARAILEGFDPIEDSPLRDCRLKGMPVIMEQPYPMRIYEQDGDIVMHLEEYDTMRTVHMGENARRMTPVPGILGHSVGRWEDRTLVVETTQMTWGWFDTVGIPLSANAVALERYTVSDDGSRLDWQMTVTDPATFTQPVNLEKFFFYVPGATVEPYDCTINR